MPSVRSLGYTTHSREFRSHGRELELASADNKDSTELRCFQADERNSSRTGRFDSIRIRYLNRAGLLRQGLSSKFRCPQMGSPCPQMGSYLEEGGMFAAGLDCEHIPRATPRCPIRVGGLRLLRQPVYIQPAMPMSPLMKALSPV